MGMPPAQPPARPGSSVFAALPHGRLQEAQLSAHTASVLFLPGMLAVGRLFLSVEMPFSRVLLLSLIGSQSTALSFPPQERVFWNLQTLLCVPLESFLSWADILSLFSHPLKGHDFHIPLGKVVLWS